MKTLYDVLGISAQATTAQIEQSYQLALDTLTDGSNHLSYEDNAIRAKAIKEAYAILSLPLRRQAYDQRLNNKAPITYQVVEQEAFPWVKLAVVLLLFGACFFAYNIHAHRAEVERIALEAEKAKAEAAVAEQNALAEQARLEQATAQQERNAEANRQREMEQARREGSQVQQQMARMDAQAAREKQLADQQAQFQKVRDDTLAQIRSRNETAAMQRALSIPIVRH